MYMPQVDNTLMKLAVKVFDGDEVAAMRWFKTSQVKLGGSRPIDHVATDQGKQEVHDLLMRMEHGVFA